MIATYIHKETGKSVYVDDFTAVFIDEGFKPKEKETPVIFKRVDDTTTYITTREIFNKEYIKK